VSEDGQHAFYAEVQDFDRAMCNPCVQSEIWPLLGVNPNTIMPRVELAEELRIWFAGLPRCLTIGCDSYTDWELLVDVFDGGLPVNIKGRQDMRALIDTAVSIRRFVAYHSVPGQPWHHTLHDAHAHRVGWIAWMDANKNKTA